MDKNPGGFCGFAFLSSYLQVPFLSTTFKSHVLLMPKNLLRLGNTVFFLLCKMKENVKVFVLSPLILEMFFWR